MQDFLSFV